MTDTRHVLGIDPGVTDYSWARYDGRDIVAWGTCAIADLPNTPLHGIKGVGIERVRAYGFRVGNETFDTCENVGDIARMFTFATGRQVLKISRKEIAVALGGSVRVGDRGINAVVGRLCPTFGKMRRGLNGHHRAAAAVAIVAWGRV